MPSWTSGRPTNTTRLGSRNKKPGISPARRAEKRLNELASKIRLMGPGIAR